MAERTNLVAIMPDIVAHINAIGWGVKGVYAGVEKELGLKKSVLYNTVNNWLKRGLVVISDSERNLEIPGKKVVPALGALGTKMFKVGKGPSPLNGRPEEDVASIEAIDKSIDLRKASLRLREKEESVLASRTILVKTHITDIRGELKRLNDARELLIGIKKS